MRNAQHDDRPVNLSDQNLGALLRPDELRKLNVPRIATALSNENIALHYVLRRS